MFYAMRCATSSGRQVGNGRKWKEMEENGTLLMSHDKNKVLGGVTMHATQGEAGRKRARDLVV